MKTENEEYNKFKEYEKRQKAKGFSKVTVWVPDVPQLKRYAEGKRNAHLKKNS